jgi:predicted ester cyclase
LATIDRSDLTVEEARRIVAPLYEALNKPSEKDVSALRARACHDDYQSYGTNQDFMTRDQLADVFSAMGKTVPDLAWEVVDIRVLDDLIIVRGEATGTPVAEFFGAAPTGKSFKTMAIDLFTVRDGRLAKGITSRTGRRRSSNSGPDPRDAVPTVPAAMMG